MTQKWVSWVLILLVIAFIGTTYYGYTQLRELEAKGEELSTAIQQTNDNINKLAQTTTDALNTLSNELDLTQTAFNHSISNVQTSVQTLSQVSSQRFEQLGGHIQRVEQESQEQISLLEQKSQEQIEDLERTISLNLKTGDFSGIIESVVKSVVSIQTDKSIGSGVFVKEGGYFVTNYHVINGATAAAVTTSDQKHHPVTILGAAPDLDIAVLKIDDSYPALNFANSDALSVGQRVIALGSPGGLQFTVTEGIISATERVDEEGKRYVQTDVPINPGNSGGPIVDASGRIVGIATKKVENFEGIGFAIPANDAKAVVDQILQ